MIAGCCQLTSIGHTLVADLWGDPDFSVFGALESETDHLPLEDHREHWEAAAFKEKQVEVSRFEDSARAEVMQACRSLFERFGGV